jgi:hypothetical protein
MGPSKGRCGRGAVNYSVVLPVSGWTYACHCQDCQAYSRSCFALYTAARRESLHILSGSVSEHRKGRADGAISTVYVCEQCVTRLYSVNSHRPDLAFVRTGALDNSSALASSAHMWTVRRAGWLDLPVDAVAWPESPPIDEFRAFINADFDRE